MMQWRRLTPRVFADAIVVLSGGRWGLAQVNRDGRKTLVIAARAHARLRTILATGQAPPAVLSGFRFRPPMTPGIVRDCTRCYGHASSEWARMLAVDPSAARA